MIDLRPVGYIIGMLTSVLGLTMLIPAAVDLGYGAAHWLVFVESAVLTTTAGALLALASRDGLARTLSIHQSFLLTSLVWLTLPFFGALPFMLGVPHLSLVDAYFEAMSGLTTTGTTAIPHLDGLPPGVNLWRGLLQWLGGLGIIIVAMIFLPVMKVGGMQFFRSEGFDTLGKILPRAMDISTALIRIYVGLTIACALTYLGLGMKGFDAIMHALTTMSTGGFSNYDASFATYKGAPEYAASVFMALAAMPFIRFVQVMRGDTLPLWRDPQVRAFLRWMGYAIAIIVLYRMIRHEASFWPTLREVTFNVVSTFTGTGYASEDVTQWGHLAFTILLISGLIGGCTASTACSVKVFRYQILFASVKAQLGRIHSPHAVFTPRFQGRTIEDDVLNSVMTFFVFFIVSLGVFAVALGLTGLDFVTSLSGAATALANVGPGLGDIIGPAGNFASLNDAAKWILIFAMLIGRLEIVAVFVLFTFSFWRT